MGYILWEVASNVAIDAVTAGIASGAMGGKSIGKLAKILGKSVEEVREVVGRLGRNIERVLGRGGEEAGAARRLRQAEHIPLHEPPTNPHVLGSHHTPPPTGNGGPHGTGGGAGTGGTAGGTAGGGGGNLRGLRPAGAVNELAGFEKSVGEAIIADGNTLVGAGDTNVRRVLQIPASEPSADSLSVTQGGRFNIAEAKGVTTGGANIDRAISQLSTTVEYLERAVPGAEIGTLEIALPTNAQLAGNWRVSGNQLVRDIAGRTEVCRIRGKVVTIRRVP